MTRRKYKTLYHGTAADLEAELREEGIRPRIQSRGPWMGCGELWKHPVHLTAVRNVAVCYALRRVHWRAKYRDAENRIGLIVTARVAENLLKPDPSSPEPAWFLRAKSPPGDRLPPKNLLAFDYIEPDEMIDTLWHRIKAKGHDVPRSRVETLLAGGQLEARRLEGR